MDEVIISRQEYEKLKMQARMANINGKLLMQLIQSIKDIRAGRIRRVK